jgi:acyl-CoA dehydrogenase
MYAISARARELRERLMAFLREVVEPGERAYFQHIAQPGQRWTIPPVMEEMKRRARAEGLWNLFLPDARHGAGLTHLDYAQLAELMGRSPIAPEVFNCSAPDTGNMEVLYLYGNEFQKKQWLEPLLAGEIRSGFAMTEPEVASSDATNIRCRILRQGDEYLVTGRKWWITGALDPRCRFFIVMGETDPEAKPYARHSMVIVPRDAPGVRVLRPLHVFGYDDAPHGHAEVHFEDVRVPLGNLIFGEGKGFEIAQGRLGPGRVHHCMRLIGLAERALEAMVARAKSRVAFGHPLTGHGMAQEAIALSRCEVEQARLLTLSCAEALDKLGVRGARDRVAMIKIVVPRMACQVIDRAIQMHGGMGLSEDSFLAHAYASARALRIADGPDEVHIMGLAKMEAERTG